MILLVNDQIWDRWVGQEGLYPGVKCVGKRGNFYFEGTYVESNGASHRLNVTTPQGLVKEYADLVYLPRTLKKPLKGRDSIVIRLK